MLVLSYYYHLLHLSENIFMITCQAQKVPNLYAFGDSIIENGRKGPHEAGLKTGYSPYGAECIYSSTSRFTDGKTIPEIIALALDSYTPVSIDEAGTHPESGVNYASASAGILPETGTILGKNYDITKQVSFFKETVENNLRPKFSSTEKLEEYLSSSLYLINIGTSDFIHNYLQPDDYDSSQKYKGGEFAELLTTKLENCLKDLYNIGARNMVVFQIGPLGCFPYILKRVKTRSRCAKDVNKLVSIFNDKLDDKLKKLSEELDGVTFITARTFDLMTNMVRNPSDYGFEDTRWPCCPTQENGLCIDFQKVSPAAWPESKDPERFERESRRGFLCMDIPPPKVNGTEAGVGKPREDLCEERKSYLFFDELHLTSAAYKIIVDKCLTRSEGGICSPNGILPRLVELSHPCNGDNCSSPPP